MARRGRPGRCGGAAGLELLPHRTRCWPPFCVGERPVREEEAPLLLLRRRLWVGPPRPPSPRSLALLAFLLLLPLLLRPPLPPRDVSALTALSSPAPPPLSLPPSLPPRGLRSTHSGAAEGRGCRRWSAPAET